MPSARRVLERAARGTQTSEGHRAPCPQPLPRLRESAATRGGGSQSCSQLPPKGPALERCEEAVEISSRPLLICPDLVDSVDARGELLLKLNRCDRNR